MFDRLDTGFGQVATLGPYAGLCGERAQSGPRQMANRRKPFSSVSGAFICEWGRTPRKEK
jgi:hypothetical protein